MEFSVTPSLETLWQYTENATYEAIAEKLYEANGKGPLGVPNGAAFAVSRIPDSVFESVNDTFHPALPADRGQLLYQYSSSTFQATTPNISIISPFVSLVQPEASGYLHLKSADYRDDPLIYSNYYGSAGKSSPQSRWYVASTDSIAGDKAAILYGYKELRKVMSDPAITPVLVKELYPGANITSDEDLWTAISQSALSFHHPVSTLASTSVAHSTDLLADGHSLARQGGRGQDVAHQGSEGDPCDRFIDLPVPTDVPPDGYGLCLCVPRGSADQEARQVLRCSGGKRQYGQNEQSTACVHHLVSGCVLRPCRY